MPPKPILKKGRKKKTKKQEPKVTEEQIRLYQQVFRRFDKDKNGTISMEGLGKVMKAIGQEVGPEELQTMINEYDKNGNGFISYVNFMEIISKRDQTEVFTEDELTEVFSVFDIDGSGTISADGLREAMRMLGNDLTEEEAKDIITKADKDEDGLVNISDFVKMMTAR